MFGLTVLSSKEQSNKLFSVVEQDDPKDPIFNDSNPRNHIYFGYGCKNNDHPPGSQVSEALQNYKR
jgi:hypothetical protein